MPIRLIRRPLAVSICAGISVWLVACSQKPAKEPPAATTTTAAAVPTRNAERSSPHAYQAPPPELLLTFAKQHLGTPAPASLGASVTITTRQPTAGGVAELAVYGASLFDPNYGPRGVVGNDTSVPAQTRFGLWIRPEPNHATLVACDIAGPQSIAVSTQIFSAAGDYIGDIGGQSLTAPGSPQQWTMAVPWDSRFAPYGVFRLMFVPLNANDAELWGCQVVTVN